jgi:hypothetical protein
MNDAGFEGTGHHRIVSDTNIQQLTTILESSLDRFTLTAASTKVDGLKGTLT